jgi:hypothetical protein
MVDKNASVNKSQITLFQLRGKIDSLAPLNPSSAATVHSNGEIAATVAVPITIAFRSRPVRNGVS